MAYILKRALLTNIPTTRVGVLRSLLAAPALWEITERLCCQARRMGGDQGQQKASGGGGAGEPTPPRLAPVASWLTEEARRRTFGSLKNIVADVPKVPGVIGLHGGLPPPHCFPFAGVAVQSSQGETVDVNKEQLSAVQMQYSIAPSGFPPLREWAAAHVREMHAPPAPCEVMVTDGNSHALEVLTSMFMLPGDPILVEEFTYPHMLECVILPKGGVPLPVPLDGLGIVPQQLRKVLEQHRSSAGSGRPPRLLYTVPVGQNPTGAVTPLERKREIYEICREFDLLIVEDDPYFFLQFPHGPGAVPGLRGLTASGTESSASSGAAGSCSNGEPSRGSSSSSGSGGDSISGSNISGGSNAGASSAGSYLSLDVDGRVVRLDSFSKFFSPGLRLGWAAAQPVVIERMAAMLQGHCLGASGVTQLMTQQLLAAWGEPGLERHVSFMQRQYAERAQAMHEAAERELAGLAEWERPTAGMFMWVKLLGVEDATDILPALRDARLVVVPGRITHPRLNDPTFKCPWVRLAFSYVPLEELREGIARLGQVLRQLRTSSA